MSQNDFINMFTIKHPEDVFQQSRLTYNALEIRDIIDRFDSSRESKPVYGDIKTLLYDTLDFSYATDPDDMHSESGSLLFSEEKLVNAFEKATEAFKKAKHLLEQYESENKLILLSAINYCKNSVKNRINELISLDNRILPLWERSSLAVMLKD